MQIAYLNKGKAKAKSQTDEMLERFYLRDIKMVWNKRKKELMELGFTEEEFAIRVKQKLNEKLGIYCQ
ncbi:hypothetical protein [Pedobacter metabolipauper]|uniref:Uncharacterized protein n=1 Tax=Pedobacter metabolipauper TaxID=425513 RepID=A0A4R6T199_9SPHI|nr:hypothetical protein [Pedobacter metabolipauper]TDQ12804.1 hypothetical protein ATK78_0011 [Pedobacter metabolipauper]